MEKVKNRFSVLCSLLLGAFIIGISCQNESALVPSPRIQLATSINGVKGEYIPLNATLTAEAGLEYVIVYKNGIAFDSQSFVGQKVVEYSKVYQVENFPIGSVVNFTFQVTDQNGKSSDVKLLELKVK